MRQGVAAEGRNKRLKACICDVVAAAQIQAAQGSKPCQQTQACVVGVGAVNVQDLPVYEAPTRTEQLY